MAPWFAERHASVVIKQGKQICWFIWQEKIIVGDGEIRIIELLSLLLGIGPPHSKHASYPFEQFLHLKSYFSFLGLF